MHSLTNSDPSMLPQTFCGKLVDMSIIQQKTSIIGEKIWLGLEYIQLILMSFEIIFDSPDDNSNFLTGFFSTLSQISSLKYFIDLKQATSLTFYMVFYTLLIFVSLKLIIFLYVTIMVRKNKHINNCLILAIWRWLFHFQGRILAFYSFSLCAYMVQVTQSSSTTSNQDYFIGATCFAVTIIEYIFSLFICIGCFYMLPNRQTFASKSNVTEIITLTSKFVLRCVQILYLPKTITIWVCASFNILFSLVRVLDYFRNFPLYKLEALYLKGSLLLLVAAFDVSCLLSLIVAEIREESNQNNLTIPTWIVISPLAVITGRNYISRIVSNLMGNASENLPLNILLLKLSLIKQISKKAQIVNPNSKKHFVSNILYPAIRNLNESPNTNQNIQTTTTEFLKREEVNKVATKYLETLMEKFPKNEFIRLYTAYYFGVKLRSNERTIRILHDLRKNCSFRINMNANLLELKVQRIVVSEYQNQKKKFDLFQYLKHTDQLNHLKKEIVNQADLQIKLYQYQIKDIGKVLSYCQAIDVQRTKVLKLIASTTKMIPNHNLELLLLCGHYHLFLNHSLVEYNRYHHEFTYKQQRYLAETKENNINEIILYNTDVILLKLKFQKDSETLITFCSRSVKNLLGWSNEEIVGQSINMILPFFNSFHCFENKDLKGLPAEIIHSYAYHQNGTLMVIDCYIDIHPILDKGIQLNLILKSRKTTLQYAIVDQHGTILSTTSGLALKIGLISPDKPSLKIGTNIRGLSNDLGEVDQACDFVALDNFHKKLTPGEEGNKATEILKKNLKEIRSFRLKLQNQYLETQKEENQINSVAPSLEKHRKLYEQFNTDGRILSINSLKSKKIRTHDDIEEFSYLCKVVYQFCDNNYLKIYTFEEMRKRSRFFDENFGQIEERPENPNNNNNELQKESKKEVQGEESNEQNKLESNVDSNSLKNVKIKLHLSKDNRNTFQSSGVNITDKGTSPKPGHTSPKRGYTSTEAKQVLKEEFEEITYKKDIAKQQNNKGNSVMTGKTGEGLQASEASTEREYRGFISALGTSYYSKFVLTFVRLVFFILIAIFSSQVTLQVIMNNTFDRLSARKDILRSAESINSLLIRIQRDMRFIISISENKLNEAQMAQYSSSTRTLLTKVNDYLVNIVIEDHKLLDSTSFLDKDDQRKIFENNVHVNDTSLQDERESISFTRFQYLSKIIDIGSSAVARAKNNVADAKNDFQYLLVNNPNDFLVESENLSQIFLEVPIREGRDNLNALLINLSVSLFCLVTSFCGAIYIIFKEYRKEKRTLLAFMKFKKNSFGLILTKINKFKVLLQNGIPLRHSQLLEIDGQGGVSHKYAKAKNDSKQQRNRYTSSKSVQRKYTHYALRFFIFLCILGGLEAGTFVIYKERIQYTDTKLNELYFTERIRARLNIGVTAAFEVLSQNNTSYIRNEPAGAQFDKILNDISLTIREIPSRFQSGNNVQAIQDIIFQDGCDYLTDKGNFDNCVAERKGLTKVNLMNLMSGLETTLKSYREKFYESNRTSEAINSIMIDMFPSTVVPNRVIYNLATLLGTLINQEFENELVSTRNDEKNISIGFDCLFVLLGLLIWLSVLKKVLEVENELKKVMKTLPLSMILSNFMLKSTFLKHVSSLQA